MRRRPRPSIADRLAGRTVLHKVTITMKYNHLKTLTLAVSTHEKEMIRRHGADSPPANAAREAASGLHEAIGGIR